jgi:hypothetical protein
VLGVRQRHIYALQDSAKKPFGLAQGQMKESAEREGRPNGESGVDGLSAPLTGH